LSGRGENEEEVERGRRRRDGVTRSGIQLREGTNFADLDDWVASGPGVDAFFTCHQNPFTDPFLEVYIGIFVGDKEMDESLAAMTSQLEWGRADGFVGTTDDTIPGDDSRCVMINDAGLGRWIDASGTFRDGCLTGS
jgi:hypothetical protein